MKILKLLLFSALIGSGVASAESPEDVLKILRSSFKAGNVNSYDIECSGGLVSRVGFSFDFYPATRQLFVSIMSKYFGGVRQSGILLFVADPGVSIFNRYEMVDTKVEENSDLHLKITSRYIAGKSVDTQRFDYDKAKKLINITLDSQFGNNTCQLN